MQKLMIPVALVLAAMLAGCGKNESDTGSSGSTSSPATSSSSTDTAPPPASTAATTPPTGTTTPDTSAAAGGNTPAGTSGSTTTAAADAGNTAAAGAAAGSAGGNGQQVFSQTCVACHGAGIAGAPKVGDKSDWGPRIAQGKDTLYQHAINGYQGKKGVMPPKGGNTALADADVKSAVDYMVSQAQ